MRRPRSTYMHTYFKGNPKSHDKASIPYTGKRTEHYVDQTYLVYIVGYSCL